MTSTHRSRYIRAPPLEPAARGGPNRACRRASKREDDETAESCFAKWLRAIPITRFPAQSRRHFVGKRAWSPKRFALIERAVALRPAPPGGHGRYDDEPAIMLCN